MGAGGSGRQVDQHHSHDLVSDFSEGKPATVMFTSGDDADAKRIVMDLLDGAGFATVDLGPLREGGALHEVGAPLSGLELHLRRRLR